MADAWELPEEEFLDRLDAIEEIEAFRQGWYANPAYRAQRQMARQLREWSRRPGQ